MLLWGAVGGGGGGHRQVCRESLVGGGGQVRGKLQRDRQQERLT
jgi:hypothetical protein